MSRRNRETTKRRLRKLIREACGDPVAAAEMPCPVSTAEQLRASGASPEEVMNWVSELMDNYGSAREEPAEILPQLPVHDPMAVVAVERYRRGGTPAQSVKDQMITHRSSTGGAIFGVGFKK